jgi:hypothetical protein
MIDAELSREDHGSIPAIAIGMGLKSFDVPRTRFYVVVKTKKINKKSIYIYLNFKLDTWIFAIFFYFYIYYGND